MGGIIFFLTLVFFREKPPTPPSKTASQERLEYSKGLKKVFKDWNFIIAIIGYSLVAASGSSVVSVLQPLTDGILDPASVGNILSIGMTASILVSFGIGILIGKTGKFKIWIVLCVTTCACCWASLDVLLAEKNKAMIWVSTLIFLTSGISVIPA